MADVEHRVGQMWQSSGAQPRLFTILELNDESARVQNVQGGRRRWIKRSRLRPPAYRFIREP